MKYTPANQFCQSNYEISYEDFRNALTVWDTVIFANRESTPRQMPNHDAKEVLFQALHEHLGLKDPFVMRRFNGSGRLCFINDGTGHYPDLKQTIHDGLARTPVGKKLYLLFTSRSRLSRPARYNPRNQSATWEHTAEDYEVLDRWIQNNFGARADDIRFAFLVQLPPDKERKFETWLGKFYQKCRKFALQCLDGIGKRLGRAASRMFRPLVITLRKQGASTSEIRHHLEQEHQDEKLPAAKTVRDWLLQEGLSEPRGRRWSKN